MKIQNQSIIRCIDFPSGAWYYYVVFDKTAWWLILSAKKCYLARQQELGQDWYIDWGVRYWIPRARTLVPSLAVGFCAQHPLIQRIQAYPDGNRRRRVSRSRQRRVMTDFVRYSIRIVRLGKMYARVHIGL